VQVAAITAIVAGITFVTWKRGQGVKQLAAAGLLAAFGSAISYGIRPLFLEFGLDAANVPLTGALIGAIAAFIYATALTRIADIRSAVDFRSPALRLFLISGTLQAIGFLAFTVALSSNEVTVVYPVTSTAPIFTLGFTALLLRGQETLSWRIALGVLLVVIGVIAL
jgi:drug/metabolite transporter (DMT)-like permease